MPIPTVLYFGRWKTPGHYTFTPEGTLDRSLWIPGLDAELLRRHGVPDEPGRGVYVTGVFPSGTHSLVTFWDRTGDGRPGSNSAFVMRGTHTADEVLAAAREAFPSLWRRCGDTITLVDGT